MLLSISCSGQDSAATLPDSAANEPTTIERANQEASSITGRGWSGFDDTGESDSTPWVNQVGASLLVFESSHANLFEGLIGRIPSDDELYALGGGAVELEGSQDNMIVAVLDEDGRFRIDRIDDGRFYVCLVEGQGPYGLLGCALVDVEGPAEWNFEEGDGLFYLYVS